MQSLVGAESGLMDVVKDAGPYATLAVVSGLVFLLCYLVRAVENYVRHLHRKSYLHYSTPRFVLSTIGFVLIADGFVIAGFFTQRLPLPTAVLTVTAGIICLIISLLLSMRPYAREVKGLRREQRRKSRQAD